MLIDLSHYRRGRMTIRGSMSIFGKQTGLGQCSYPWSIVRICFSVLMSLTSHARFSMQPDMLGAELSHRSSRARVHAGSLSRNEGRGVDVLLCDSPDPTGGTLCIQHKRVVQSLDKDRRTNTFHVVTQCCAIDYLTHTLDGASALLNNVKFFPSRYAMKKYYLMSLLPSINC